MQEVRHQVLTYLATPDHALLVFFLGALLLYWECNRPGSVLPGAAGTVLVLLALHAFAHQSVHLSTLFLLVAAAGCILLEAGLSTRGLLAGLGAVALAVATVQLGNTPVLAAPLSLAFGLITALLLKLSVRARRNKFQLRAAKSGSSRHSPDAFNR